VSTVSISITDVDGGPNYFNGSTYAAGGPFFLGAQGSVNNWTYNNASMFFLNDHRYDITAKATDNSGISASVTNRFVYDVKAATAIVSTPTPLYFTSLPTISGSVTDNPGNIYNKPGRLVHVKRSGGGEVGERQLVERVEFLRRRPDLYVSDGHELHNAHAEHVDDKRPSRASECFGLGQQLPLRQPQRGHCGQPRIRNLERQYPRRRRVHRPL